jgi:hypothetical protein
MKTQKLPNRYMRHGKPLKEFLPDHSNQVDGITAHAFYGLNLKLDFLKALGQPETGPEIQVFQWSGEWLSQGKVTLDTLLSSLRSEKTK